VSSYSIVLLPGDGIGVEVMNEAKKCLKIIEDKSDLTFEMEEIPCGGKYFLENGQVDWPEGSEKKCDEADFILLGAVGWPDPDGKGPVMMPNGHMAGYSAVLGNRGRLNLFANVRPVKLYPGVMHLIHGEHKKIWRDDCVDMVFVRENTEGLYVSAGGNLDRGGIRSVAIDNRITTREGCDQVIRFAFELCKKRNKGAPIDGQLRVTCITKENVMDGCRLFKSRFLEIGEEYAEIEKDTCIVDAFTQSVITQPEFYDVLVVPNMFGDIVTDLAAVLQGGMGVAAGANLSLKQGMFEPIHGSAPDLAGKDICDPIGMIMALKQALEWLGGMKKDAELTRVADAIEKCVASLLLEGKALPQDLVDGQEALKCSEMGDKIVDCLRGSL
jgi:isocitrate/isopropylmalate dehydrogenase